MYAEVFLRLPHHIHGRRVLVGHARMELNRREAERDIVACWSCSSFSTARLPAMNVPLRLPSSTTLSSFADRHRSGQQRIINDGISRRSRRF